MQIPIAFEGCGRNLSADELPGLGDEVGGEQAHQFRLPIDLRLDEDLLELIARRADRDPEPVGSVLQRASTENFTCQPRFGARQPIALCEQLTRIAAFLIQIDD